MNYSKLSLFFIFLLLLSCSKDNDSTNLFEVVTDQQISVIRLNGTDFERFYYDDNGRITEVQTDYQIIDNDTQEVEDVISSRYFIYDENGLLDYVLRGSIDTIDVSYDEEDIIIDGFHNQFDAAFLRFNEYLLSDGTLSTMYLEQNASCLFIAEYDEHHNYLHSTTLAGESLEDGCPGYYYLSQYYGEYAYDEMHHPYSSLPVEVQYVLYQKPFVNCVTNIQRNAKRIEYEYEYNSNGYPVTSEAITIYPSGPDTIFHGKKEYIYN